MKFKLSKFFMAASLFTFGITGVYAASLELVTNYDDPRFEPANILHAGCLNSVDVVLTVDEDVLYNLEGELQYDPDDLNILRVEKYQDELDYELDYEAVRFDFMAVQKGETELFRLHFKSREDLTGTVVNLKIGDSVQSFEIPFAAVPECQPDIIPPTVRLLSPENDSQGVALDSAFLFEFKDLGKGVEKDSLQIYLDGILYDSDSKSVDRDGMELTVFPQDWLPVGEEMLIEVKVADKQIYGGANEISKKFKVITATGVLLNSAIEPDKLRGLLQETLVAQGTSSECALLQKMYANADLYYKYKFRKILNKLSCEIPDDEVLEEFLTKDDTNLEVTQMVVEVPTNEKSFSVFCVLGWLLFVVTLILKVYYFVSHKKYKKMERSSRGKK